MTAQCLNSDFHSLQRQEQIAWRKKNISSSALGYQNKNCYEHIIPRSLWEETLWPHIRNPLKTYLNEKQIHSHPGTHNLLSSWVLCTNLYFIIRIEPAFRQLMLGFLQEQISSEITAIIKTELEFASEEALLSPEHLLGEMDGTRGSGQTSPDVAFLIETKGGKGIILTECKYTEHSFYPCSARRTTDRGDKPANPDPGRCMKDALTHDYKSICHQAVWQRKYWDNLTLSPYGKSILKRCPASSAGYQLLRQHSLAEGIAASNKYGFVVTSVAFDDRNLKLKNCLYSTGIPDFAPEWGKLFTGKALFKTWTHQQWVAYVKHNGKDALQKEWSNYMNNRYGF